MASVDVNLKMNVKMNLIEDVTIELGDTKIIVPRAKLVRALLNDIVGSQPAAAPAGMPEIGELWEGQGGVFSGIYRLRRGRTCVVITGPRFAEEETWQAMMAKAQAVEVDGHNDFRLPLRIEQLLQFSNVPELFEKEVYWSNERYAYGSSYAWCQSFSHGNQNHCHMGYELRGCAVRSFEI